MSSFGFLAASSATYSLYACRSSGFILPLLQILRVVIVLKKCRKAALVQHFIDVLDCRRLSRRSFRRIRLVWGVHKKSRVLIYKELGFKTKAISVYAQVYHDYEGLSC